MSRPWPLRALFAADAVSIAGTSMTFLALPWFVLVTTGSATQTGIVTACETVPLVLAAAAGGPLIDRLGARRAAVFSDLASAVGVALIPLVHQTVGLDFWQLCVLVALVGLARAPGDTARRCLLPGLVEMAGTPIERATSAYDGVSRGARMVGAPTAGALIAILGPANVLLVDALSFLVAAALVACSIPRTATPPVSSDLGYVLQLREGWRGLRADRLMTAMTAMVCLTNLLDAAFATVLLPVYARTVLHSVVALGTLFGVFGLGALLGTVVYGVVGPSLPRWPLFTAAFLLMGLPRFGLLAAGASYGVLLVAQLLLGVACGCLNPILSAVGLERVRPELRSRVFSVSDAGALAGAPLGAIAAGVSVSQLGLTPTLLGAGALYLFATLSPLLWAPLWRQLDATRPTRPLQPAPVSTDARGESAMSPKGA